MKNHQVAETHTKDKRNPWRLPLPIIFVAGIVCGFIIYAFFSFAIARDVVRSSPTGQYHSDTDAVVSAFYMAEDGKSGVWQLQNLGQGAAPVGGKLVPTETEHTYKLQLKDGTEYGVANFTPGATLFDPLSVQVLSSDIDRTFHKVNSDASFQRTMSNSDSTVSYTHPQNINEALDILGISA